ncbi:MAG: bifunctional pyr operon transcriptional regulator/uracil phosphoribosyltransferase PyrR [Gammaproteobacteria bacterium]|nr:bifunctional pyr operon transcriptional regulator/uracil phosphoribosyltransferase PyrR [Gammaproteobacteria bacterium]
MKREFDLDNLVDELAVNLRRALDADEILHPTLVGIRTGGVWIAQRLRTLLQVAEPLGELNIAFYRDDFSRIGVHPTVEPSNLPFEVDNRDLILVDDILYTGRTIRAAMNEIFDYGRPRSIRLVVLFERTGRELPIQADIVGAHLKLKPREHAKLTGPDPLALEIHRK